jgi:RNA polymerase sigma-70 factor (ECF subfamily)
MKSRGQPALKTLSVEAEAILIGQAQGGDREAFGKLVRTHYPDLVQVIYSMCGDPQLAQDATQEAFVRAWLRLDSYRPLTPLRNWLYRIAVNAALDMLRRQAKSVELVEELMTSDSSSDPEASLMQKERTVQVQEAILSLTPTSRAVMILREYGQLSYQEIAVALSIPTGTVMSRLNYARNRLRELLKAQLSLAEAENG